MFWPLSTNEFGLHAIGSYYISIFSPVNIAIELILFTIATLIFYKTGDLKVILNSKKVNKQTENNQ